MMTLEHLKDIASFALRSQVGINDPFYGGYYSPYYTFMQCLAIEMGEGCLCVELGVETGRGSYSFLKGGALVIGVEHDPLKNVERLLGEKNFTLVKADSMPMPVEISECGMEISVLHIDTEHSYSMAKAEFEAYRPLLKDGAVVCFDDTNAQEGEVLRFVRELPYERIENDDLHPQCGYAAVIYRKAEAYGMRGR